MATIPQLLQQEGIVSGHTERRGRRQLLEPKQKNISWKKDVFQKISTTVNVLMDAGAR